MKSLSNVIKAYAVRYQEEKRTVDLNAEADRRVQNYIQSRLGNQEQKNDEFVEGIPALHITAEEDLPEEIRMQLGLSSPAKDTQENRKEQEELLAKEREENRKKIEEDTEEILEEVRQQVSQMLYEAKNEAESMKHQILKEAQEKGYAEGLNKGTKEAEAIRSALEEEKRQLEEQYENTMTNLEPQVAELVIALMKKLTGVLLEERRDIILYLIEQAFSETESNHFLIRVSKEDYELVAGRKAELLWKLKEGTGIEVIEDLTLSKSQCMIETDSRIIDCSLDVQMKNLASDLMLLAGKRQ